jgi:hypothetical protein
MQTASLEGVLARYVGGQALTEYLARQPEALINTDDRNVIDYAFARTLGQDYHWHINDLRAIARQLNAHRPTVTGGEVDWARVNEQYLGMFIFNAYQPPEPEWLTEAQRHRINALVYYLQNQPQAALNEWQQQEQPPQSPLELAIIADALAQAGSEMAPEYIDALRRVRPLEAGAVLTHWHVQNGNLDSATAALHAALVGLRDDPWPWPPLMRRALGLASPLAQADSSLAPVLLTALDEPFAVHLLNDNRRFERLAVANEIGLKEIIEALDEYEPYVPWTWNFLANRAQWYNTVGHDRAVVAYDEWKQFADDEPTALTMPADQ